MILINHQKKQFNILLTDRLVNQSLEFDKQFINHMSIYSGFATRLQQQSYDHCVDSLLYVLQKRLIKFYQNQPADQPKFIGIVVKLHHQMRSMQKSKYLQPKSSHSVNQLVKIMHHLQQNSLAAQQLETETVIYSEQLPDIDHKSALPEVSNERKKSVHWVQRLTDEVHSNRTKTLSQQQVQTVGTISKIPNQKRNEEHVQLKRTIYQPSNVRAFNLKPNLSRSRQENAPPQQKGRSKAMSGFIHQKPVIQSKVTYNMNTTQNEVNYNIHKRKHKSSSRSSNQGDVQVGGHNEVADIIKDYIIKAKKTSASGMYNNKISRQASAKLTNF